MNLLIAQLVREGGAMHTEKGVCCEPEETTHASTLRSAIIPATILRRWLRRFDRYAVVVDDGAREILIYKHAIVGITDLGPSP